MNDFMDVAKGFWRMGRMWGEDSHWVDLWDRFEVEKIKRNGHTSQGPDPAPEKA